MKLSKKRFLLKSSWKPFYLKVSWKCVFWRFSFSGDSSFSGENRFYDLNEYRTDNWNYRCNTCSKYQPKDTNIFNCKDKYSVFTSMIPSLRFTIGLTGMVYHSCNIALLKSVDDSSFGKFIKISMWRFGILNLFFFYVIWIIFMEKFTNILGHELTLFNGFWAGYTLSFIFSWKSL